MIANKGSKEPPFNNIIKCENLFEERASDEKFAYSVMEQIKRRAEKKALENADEITKEQIKDLEVKCMTYKKKLQRCIPPELLVCVIVSSCIIASCVTVIVIQLTANIKVIDYHVLLFNLVGGVGLFHTSISTVKGWKKYLNEEKG